MVAPAGTFPEDASEPVRSRLVTAAAAALAAPWVAWAVVRIAGLDVGHPVVGAMALTPYAAITAPIPVLVAIVLGRRRVAAVALAAAVVLLVVLLPRAFAGPAHAPAGAGGPELTVMTFNLFAGRADSDEVVRLVRREGVDVLSLQELTPGTIERLDAAGLGELLPHRVLDERPGGAGAGLLARAPLRPAGPPPRDALGAQPEAALDVAGAGTVHVRAVHPYPPVNGHREDLWEAELRALPGPREGAAPRILAGDLNATLDHRAMRRLLDRGYTDAADATGQGLTPTWPVGRRRPPITIDHVLMPEGVRAREVSVHEITGSDHRAVVADLILTAAADG